MQRRTTHAPLASQGGALKLYFILYALYEGYTSQGDALKLYEPKLGPDGLPEVGARLTDHDPIAVIVDEVSGKFTVKRHKNSEDAFVEEVGSLKHKA